MKLGIILTSMRHVADLGTGTRAVRSPWGRSGPSALGTCFSRGEAIRETFRCWPSAASLGYGATMTLGLCSHPSALASFATGQYAGPVLDYLATYRPPWNGGLPLQSRGAVA